jgi:hypothetical protein
VARERLPLRERTLLFGDGKSLVGIITEPAPVAEAEPRPAVILLNAGILHRVGPNRVHVRLAREMAAVGFPVLRFDYSGIGDSRPRMDGLPFARSALAETQQGMDVLTASRGVRRFLLAGICSGADSALSAAAQDERVAGVALVEPYAIPGPAFPLYQYRRRILDPRSWWRLLRGRSEILGSLRAHRAEPAGGVAPVAPTALEPAPDFDSIVPSRREFARRVSSLVERGAGLCFVYSSESPAYFNYLTLLRGAVRRARVDGRVRVQVLEDTDHVFTPLAVQDAVVRTIRDWALAMRP